MRSDTPDLDVRRIVATIRKVVGDNRREVALHEPHFAGREWDYVRECLDTGWVSTAGAYVGQFERRVAETCGVRDAIVVMNGTAALHLALLMIGVRPGDEVIVPTLTFAATANAASHAGAIPHFVDSEEHALGLDVAKLDRYLETTCEPGKNGPINKATGRRIAAVIPMHVFGHPVDMDKLNEIAARHSVTVVEDAAESLGSVYKNRPAGSLGRLGALSFNGNKIVTTGGGGAVVTNDVDLARHARHVATTARIAHRWEIGHDEVGYNYRMPNLNAALGCAQLEQIESFVAAKRRLAERYIEAFADVPGVRVLREPSFARSNYWLNSLVIDDELAICRDALLQATNDAGLATRPVWKLMHRLPMYAACPRMDLSAAERHERRVVSMPSSAVLGFA